MCCYTGGSTVTTQRPPVTPTTPTTTTQATSRPTTVSTTSTPAAQCGIQRKRQLTVRPRIVGGNNADPHEYPWQVLLQSLC